LAEFTGERLIPGEVDIDLLNEHMARYHFAVRLARGKRVLDAGCGAVPGVGGRPFRSSESLPHCFPLLHSFVQHRNRCLPINHALQALCGRRVPAFTKVLSQDALKSPGLQQPESGSL
jgi:hypothetical protein